MSKIVCTNLEHTDSTPSMEVYSDGGFCFSCGYVDRSVADTNAPTREPEDIVSTLLYIKSLPVKTIRGLKLPYDNEGYYIVWPSGDFYKKRLWDGPGRYRAPVGVQQPLLVHESINTKAIVIVEGELNAMSLHHSIGPVCVIASPGSATNLVRSIEYYLQFYRCYVILDKDAAGVAAGITLKREMLSRGRRIELICIEKDFNDILQQEGPEGVKKEFKQALAL